MNDLVKMINFRTALYILSVSVIVTSCDNRSKNREITAHYFDKIKQQGDNAKLTMFFTQMPKGGDLHHHYSGALYVETYLDWAAGKNLRMNTTSFMLDTMQTSITIDSLRSNDALYRKVLEEWSDADFSNNFHIENPPDQHFFNTFPFFGKIAAAFCREGLAEIKQEAVKENVQYIETQLGSPKVHEQFRGSLTDSLVYFQSKKDTLHIFQIFNLMVQAIQVNPSYDAAMMNYVDSLHSYHQGIDDSNFTMRFQVYCVRRLPPQAVFTSLYGCFDAVTRDRSTLIVGVNIVAPENDYVSMRDYWLHMQMFRYLKKKFPTVKTDMHAGELSLGMVKPVDLTYHINDAVFTAGADRIGHGVDIPYETNAPELLKKMKKDSIAVEINLTSNEFILGVKGNDHPVNLYNDAGVPIVISTDDEGVSRNNLASQYVLLASRYHFSYNQIKTFVYNSIRYSFLSKSEKMALEEKLNKRFDAFEAMIAQDHGNGK